MKYLKVTGKDDIQLILFVQHIVGLEKINIGEDDLKCIIHTTDGAQFEVKEDIDQVWNKIQGS